MTDERHGAAVQVLFIGDNEGHAAAAGELLAAAGLPAEFVVVGPELDRALGPLLDGGYAVAFVDHALEHFSCIDLIQAARAQDCKTPIVVLTGHTTSEFEHEILSAGALECWDWNILTAPVLRCIVRNVVARSSTSAPNTEASAHIYAPVKSAHDDYALISAVFSSASDAILIVNSAGIVTEFNPAAGRMFGDRYGEMRGTAFADLVLLPGDVLPIPASGSKDPIEALARPTSGVQFPIRLTVASIPNVSDPIYIAYVTDIREQKRAEHALAMGEQRFRILGRATNDAVWDWDLMGGTLWWNEGFATLFGYSMDELEPGIESWTNRTHPEDVQRVYNGILEAIRKGEQRWSDEYRFRRADGSYADVLDRGILQRDEHGRPVRMIGSMLDITASKQAEAALRDSEARFRRVVESNMIGVFFWNRDGRIMDPNDAFLNITGYSREDMQNLPVYWQNLTPPEYRQQDQDALREHDIQGTCKPYETEFIRRDGSRVYVLVGSTLLEGSQDNGVAFVLDISERKYNEEALRYRAKFEALISNISASFLNLPSDQVDEGINSALEALGTFSGVDRAFVFQWTENESLVSNTHEWCAEGVECRQEFGQNLNPRDYAWVAEQLLGLGAIHVPDVETVPFKTDKERESIRGRGTKSMVLVPMAYRGKLTGHLGLETTRSHQTWSDDDIAMLRVFGELVVNALERKKAEEAILNANEELEVRVQHRTAELEAARAEAERANHAKSEFLSRMSHELRTPLNAILGFGQLLAADDLPPKRKQGVSHILQAGHHLLALINEVLDISRIEAGSLSLNLETVSAWQLIGEALDLVRPLADQNGIRLINGVRDTAPWQLVADRQRILQSLLNLLSNAVKYNRSGGSVSVTAQPVEGNTLRIYVQDTGHGLTEEEIGKLFTPFERLGAVHTRIEGTGIGLVLTKQLIHAMSGNIGIESTPGTGSTFWIEMPLASGSPNSRVPESFRHTILYIADNEASIQLVESILESRPEIHVTSTTRGHEGLALAQSQSPNLILLDVHPTDTSATEVLMQLQQQPSTKNIPIVLIGDDAAQEWPVQEPGTNFTLPKPLVGPNFLALVDEILAEPVLDKAQ